MMRGVSSPAFSLLVALGLQTEEASPPQVWTGRSLGHD